MPTRRRSSPSAFAENEESKKFVVSSKRLRTSSSGGKGSDPPQAGVLKLNSVPQNATVVKLGDLCPELSSDSLSPSKSQDREVHRHQDHEQQLHHDDHLFEESITLHQLVAPLDEQVFLTSCFRQSAVHIPASVAGKVSDDRLKGLSQELFDLDPGSILSSTASENIFVWLRHSPAVTTSESHSGKIPSSTQPPHDLIHSIEVSDPDTAVALYRAGHATYCRAPPSLERYLVSSLLAGTGLGCGQFDPTAESSTCMGRGEVEIFMGTAGHRTNWHWDFQENFTVQLSGTKRWTLQRGSVAHPLRGCTPHYRSPESVEPQLKAAHLVDPDFEFGHPSAQQQQKQQPQEQVILQPGDVLYFPAGMWHKVEVIEPGVSLNVSLMATNYASLTCQALQHLLLQKSEWRESIVNNSTTNAVSHLKSLLRQLPSIIQEFEQQEGAEAILPPAVRSPVTHPLHERVEDDEDEDDDEDAGDVVDVTRGRSKPLPYQCTERQLRDHMRTHRVIRNPLATMIRESDIFKFYKKGDEDEEGELASPEVFVLNVNYAGNESHESVIRARILGTGSLLPHVFVSTRDSNCREILPDAESWIDSEAERTMLGCLVYYGFLIWIPRGASGDL